MNNVQFESHDITVFSNSEFGQIRTLIIDGEPWFIGADVARALGYSNYADAINRHCKGVVKHDVIDGVGRHQLTNIIPEGDLYRLALKSKLPSAEKFADWICDEVLPTLRKTGEYILDASIPSYQIENPAERARRWADEYEERVMLAEQNRELEEQNTQMKPKALVYDKLIESNMLVNFRDAAKEIGISQSQFTGWLKDNKYVYANSNGELRPMEPYMESGLFAMKPYVNPHNGFSGSRTFLTPRGLTTFKMMLDGSGNSRYTLRKHGGRRKRAV